MEEANGVAETLKSVEDIEEAARWVEAPGEDEEATEPEVQAQPSGPEAPAEPEAEDPYDDSWRQTVFDFVMDRPKMQVGLLLVAGFLGWLAFYEAAVRRG